MKTKQKNFTTDSLGFTLRVSILVGQFDHLGQHRTYEDRNGNVPQDAEHTIRIHADLSRTQIVMVASHEAYHLFVSVRKLIAVDEEMEAEVFGDLVAKIVEYVEATVAETPEGATA